MFTGAVSLYHVTPLVALRNALYKFSTYLLTYLLTYSNLMSSSAVDNKKHEITGSVQPHRNNVNTGKLASVKKC